MWQRRVATALSVAVGVLVLGAAGGVARQATFTTTDLPLPQRIYDLGVAYVNGDSDPDLFTTAHNNRQVVLLGDGNGNFDDEISDLDLDHTPQFPGLEAINNAPTPTDPGLYVFYRPDGLRLLAHGTSASGVVRSRAIRNARAKNGAIAGIKVVGPGDLPNTRVDYDIPPGAQVDLKLVPMALPVRVNSKAPGAVFVGSQAVPANKSEFTIQVRDRHGMGWADTDADGDTDVLIARGGLAGRIKSHGNLVQDELMIQSGGKFTDQAEAQGLQKGRCRARDAVPVDADGDARTDLSISCTDGPNRLFLRDGAAFDNASGPLKAVGARGPAIEWVDLRGGPIPEHLTFNRGDVRVFQRTRRGRWQREQRISGLPRGDVVSIASADYDNDGDADVLVSAEDGLSLLRNRDGELALRNPAAMGLPATAAGPVVWIDYQNDGLLDLYAPPGGIYAQQPGGDFAPTGLLTTGELRSPRAAWMDVDGDGDRDGALTARDVDGRFSSLFTNHLVGDHWLEVEVEGRDGSREAPGARVRIEADGAEQTQWIGQSDSSRFSTGDWRVYFGLANETSVDRVTVRWTDGDTQVLTDVPDNQLLRVERP